MASDGELLEKVESLDLLLVGAGISGINCAYRLQTQLPQARFAILEARDDVGGTWDLFKYPGIRSDSDLHTFGFAWHPWPHRTAIAEGPLIVSYMKECISTYGLDKYLNFRHRVLSAQWSSKTQKWTVVVDNDGRTKHYTTSFFVLGAGYYDYHQPLKVDIPGIANFKGKIIHPQFWPQDYDYSNQKMVVIGSGATAVTLVPNLAKKAAHVTMLQRSPTYIMSMNNKWPGPSWFRKIWPRGLLSLIERSWFMIIPHLFNRLCQWLPSAMRAMIKKDAIRQLPPGYEFDRHFKPKYNPWQQRLCLAPDGDFYRSLHSPRVDVVTAQIKTVKQGGIELTNGETLEADVIVTATGLNMLFGGGIPLTVDGEQVVIKDKILWNGAMIQDVPNLFYMIGYTNASWTLGADDTAFIINRLLKHMKRNHVHVAVPRLPRDSTCEKRPSWDLISTYVKAAEDRLPKSGNQGPWRPKNNFVNDYFHARYGNITSGLHFVA